MLGEHDGVDLAHGIFHRVVDDKVIVGVGSLKLDLGADEALLDLLGAVRSASGQALLQRLPMTCRAPCTSISRITSFPCAMASST